MVNSIATALATVASATGARMNRCKEKVWSHNSNFISHIPKKYLVCLNTAIYCTEINCFGLIGLIPYYQSQHKMPSQFLYSKN